MESDLGGLTWPARTCLQAPTSPGQMVPGGEPLAPVKKWPLAAGKIAEGDTTHYFGRLPMLLVEDWPRLACTLYNAQVCQTCTISCFVKSSYRGGHWLLDLLR